MTQYRHIDTKRADGCYVTFTMITTPDNDASPHDYLFQDPDYQEEDQARLDAFNAGDWSFVGTQARADITVVRNGVGTSYTLTSAGLWGTESDSDASYFAEIYEEEKAQLIADINAIKLASV
jgi:hypothetical protein